MELHRILISLLLWCNATWLFHWFYQKLLHFQWENVKKKVVLLPNPSGRFFFFSKLSLFFFSSNHGACYIKTRAHAPSGLQHRMPGMPCLVERFLQQSGGYLLQKYTVFMGKKYSMHLSKYGIRHNSGSPNRCTMPCHDHTLLATKSAGCYEELYKSKILVLPSQWTIGAVCAQRLDSKKELLKSWKT